MEIYNTWSMRSLENSAADFACFTNDIFSYLVTAYYSAAVLVLDALGILEDVEIGC